MIKKVEMIKKKIPVKIGWGMLLIVYGIAVPLLYYCFTDPILGGIIVTIFYIIFVSITIFGIKYWIEDRMLIIQNGFFGKTEINIESIYRIEKTWNAISSPAPSFTGRVEIYYPNNSIVISPKNFDEFKEEMLRINPEIEIRE